MKNFTMSITHNNVEGEKTITHNVASFTEPSTLNPAIYPTWSCLLGHFVEFLKANGYGFNDEVTETFNYLIHYFDDQKHKNPMTPWRYVTEKEKSPVITAEQSKTAADVGINFTPTGLPYVSNKGEYPKAADLDVAAVKPPFRDELREAKRELAKEIENTDIPKKADTHKPDIAAERMRGEKLNENNKASEWAKREAYRAGQRDVVKDILRRELRLDPKTGEIYTVDKNGNKVKDGVTDLVKNIFSLILNGVN